jgi:hypothetical protein
MNAEKKGLKSPILLFQRVEFATTSLIDVRVMTMVYLAGSASARSAAISAISSAFRFRHPGLDSTTSIS